MLGNKFDQCHYPTSRRVYINFKFLLEIKKCQNHSIGLGPLTAPTTLKLKAMDIRLSYFPLGSSENLFRIHHTSSATTVTPPWFPRLLNFALAGILCLYLTP